MFIGSLRIDLLLGDIHSLKEKRSVVKPLLREVRRQFDVAVAEVGHQELHRRTEIGATAVSCDAGHVREVLEKFERAVVGRPEVEVLSVRQRLINEEDL